MNIQELAVEKQEVIICGEEIKVSPETKIVAFLQEELKRRGVDVFSIFIDGEEVLDATKIPQTFGEIETLEVVRNVKGGNGK
jgi:hypothetical protein